MLSQESAFSHKKSVNDLQSCQIYHLRQLLNLYKKNNEDNFEEDCVWKIIIYDKFCQDILSTLFKVPNH